MGKLTLQDIAFRARKHPTNPKQLQIQFAMGASSQALMIRGIVLNVSIGVDRFTAEALRAQSLSVPNPITVPAMVDTGASHLGLDTNIIRSLNLSRRGVTTCDTAAGRRVANLYAVSISFPGTKLQSYDLLRVADVNLAKQPFKCLIGRQTMRNWHMHYNGQSGTISISD